MYKELLKILPAEIIKFNEPMREHTSFKIGGPVDLMVLPQNTEEVIKAAVWCRRNDVPLFIFGLGSNLLVREKGIRGVAVKIGHGLDKVVINGHEITAEAGISLADLSLTAAENGLRGLEFAEGIPGSLGGAVFALVLVVGLILGLAWLVRRMPGLGGGAANPALRIVGSLALGPRDRLVVVEVGQTQLLLGVGAGGTRTLHTLEQPLPGAEAKASPAFAQLLAQHFGKKP